MLTAVASGFVMGWISSMPIAGAVSVFVCQRGLTGRWRQGLAMAMGAALAEGAWCLIAYEGASRLVGRLAIGVAVARVVGGVLLIGLGTYFLRRHTTLGTNQSGEVKPARPLRAEFRNGAMLVALNPMIPFNWLALLTAAVSFGMDPDLPASYLAMGVSTGVASWFAFLVWMLSRLRRQLAPRLVDGALHVLGGVLVVAGLVVFVRAWFH